MSCNIMENINHMIRILDKRMSKFKNLSDFSAKQMIAIKVLDEYGLNPLIYAQRQNLRLSWNKIRNEYELKDPFYNNSFSYYTREWNKWVDSFVSTLVDIEIYNLAVHFFRA